MRLPRQLESEVLIETKYYSKLLGCAFSTALVSPSFLAKMNECQAFFRPFSLTLSQELKPEPAPVV